MHVKISSNVQECKDWSIEVEVLQDTTVGELKKILASPPHDLDVPLTTKVLWRRPNCLMSLEDTEKARQNLVFHNFTPATQVLPFPDGFMWGTATASYQVEGAAGEGGRTPSIWDAFAEVPGHIQDGSSGQTACDHYHRVSEDVRLMRDLGLPAYRFSISWSRLLPSGRGEPNPEGVGFYSRLLDELGASGITPVVTLYHWDLPLCLENEYGGWLGRQVIQDFEHYAVTCFKAFGSRVKWWVTLNEPWCAAALGYASGEHAPGRKARADSEPYVAAHHMILAHARAVWRYRNEFHARSPGGAIGLALNMDWKEPRSGSPEDREAQRRALDWQLGWFAEPVFRGRYPESMRRRCGGRLPRFTAEEQHLVRGTADFFGLNHYSTDYVAAKPGPRAAPGSQSSSYFADQEVDTTSDPRWAKTDMDWDIVPWGFQRLVALIQEEYPTPQGILITENGCAFRGDHAAHDDGARVEYLQGYLTQLHQAIKGGAHVRGYFVWSFMDNFEWAFGYTKLFGIVHVDRKTLARTPKASAAMMSQVARENALRVPTKVMLASGFTPMGADDGTEGRKPAAQQAAKPSTSSSHTSQGQKDGRASRGGRDQGDGGGERPSRGRGSRGEPVQIAVPDAIKMLEELCAEYENPEFQRILAQAYRQFMSDGNEVALVKAQVNACLPVQAIVLPSYGFEGTTQGAHRAKIALRAEQFLGNDKVRELNHRINVLMSELPMKEAQRQHEEDMSGLMGF